MAESAYSACSHLQTLTDVSGWGDHVGYKRATAAQRIAAITSHGQVKRVADERSVDPKTFPAPLVLPGDDLALDPKYPKQSFRSWLREKERNSITPARNIIYVAHAPHISKKLKFVHGWTAPNGKPPRIDPSQLAKPIVEYLSAFFHGLPVRTFFEPLNFVPWEETDSQSPDRIGLQTSTECIGIKTRACPDSAFPRQLSVSDLIDGVISILPHDAYSLVLIVHHDIYECESDDFLCGRAYGGSRAAVVSTARYNPYFDARNHIDSQHAWPASHCLSYVKSELAAYDVALNSDRSITLEVPEVPLIAAIEAYRSCLEHQTKDLAGLWLSRVCRTTSHELGHCFGMDHCVYYACNMQGTAGIPEDVRQPPYLCPICLAKLLYATETDMNDRYGALLSFCDRWKHVPMFAAYTAWLRRLL